MYLVLGTWCKVLIKRCSYCPIVSYLIYRYGKFYDKILNKRIRNNKDRTNERDTINTYRNRMPSADQNSILIIVTQDIVFELDRVRSNNR